MMGAGFGRGIAEATAVLFVVCIVGAVAVGVALAFAVPALWHMLANHVSVH